MYEREIQRDRKRKRENEGCVEEIGRQSLREICKTYPGTLGRSFTEKKS